MPASSTKPSFARKRSFLRPCGKTSAALAEFERDLIRERTRAGLTAARVRSRKGGRPRAMNETQIAMARAMLADRTKPIAEICAALRVSKATLYRYLPASERP